jgi:hypothetical protein
MPSENDEIQRIKAKLAAGADTFTANDIRILLARIEHGQKLSSALMGNAKRHRAQIDAAADATEELSKAQRAEEATWREVQDDIEKG